MAYTVTVHVALPGTPLLKDPKKLHLKPTIFDMKSKVRQATFFTIALFMEHADDV